MKPFPVLLCCHHDTILTSVLSQIKELVDKVDKIYTLRSLVSRVRNLKFATYLKFATCENTNKINELW